MDGMTYPLEVRRGIESSPPTTLDLDIRISKITGRPVLHFPYMAISDIHWGSKFTRAKRLCMAFRDIESDEIKVLGDTVGGVEMTKKETWHLGPWHRQGIALLLQKTEISAVTNLRGNHEQGLEKHLKTPKHIFGVEMRQSSKHKDPRNRLLLEEHGDRHDLDLFKTPENQAWWYGVGDTLLTIVGEVDSILQDKLGWEKASTAQAAKRLLKTLINRKMGVLAAMEREIDASPFDGSVSGHSHMGGFHRTPAGKVLINDGCCTDHVQFVVHDRHGNWALIEHHRDRMNVEMETGYKYTVTWRGLELDHFSKPPQAVENLYTDRADRLLRMASHLWPARDRQRLNEEIAAQDRMADRLLRSLDIGPGSIEEAVHAATAKKVELCALRRDAPYSGTVASLLLPA